GLQNSPTTSTLTSMTTTIPANALAAGTYQLFVTNPSPGGGTSAILTFRVNATSATAPTITRVSPSSIAAGSGPAAVTVEGTGFTSGTTASLDSVSGAVSANTVV